MELLVAGTVFAVLLMGVGGHLRGSVVAWRRTTSTVEQLQGLRVALDRLRSDLASAFVFESSTSDGSPTVFPPPLFTSNELRWYMVSRGPTASQGSASDRVRFISYRLEPLGAQLALTRMTQTAGEAAANLPTVSETLVASLVQCAFRYGTLPEASSTGGTPAQIQWQNDWTNLTQLPQLVEVTMTLGTGSMVPSPLRQVFVVPSGSLTPSQGTGP